MKQAPTPAVRAYKEPRLLLVYDDNCPLCKWYSNQFVKYGFLEKEGRRPFSSIDDTLLRAIDYNRGVNEIPLINTATGEVLYGVDALLEILGGRFAWMKKTGKQKPVYWFVRKLYKFISYNRKVIVARKCSTGAIDCSPAMNYRYRFLFLFIFLLFNTIMLFPLHNNVLVKLPGYHLSILSLQTGHSAFVMINCLLALSFPKPKAIEFLGQANMLALQTILALSPLLLLSLLSPPVIVYTAWLALTAVFIFKEYLRRMDYLSLLSRHRWVAGINLACMSGFILYLFS